MSEVKLSLRVRPDCEAAPWVVEEIKLLETQVEAATARADAAEGLHVYLYNSGYMAGHDATVEGCFTDIHQSDMKTYHADVVKDILKDKP